jgi:lipoyl(octanoyl) transferase
MPRTCPPSKKAYFAEYLGIVPYELASNLQQKLCQARAEDNTPDILLLLQHPPVFTIGRFRGEEDIIALPEGIEVFHINRGGSVTYHGPGQLVGYPILDLKENGLGVREYIWKLEEVIINLLLRLGIQGHRSAQYPGGVWVGEGKICSIGIHVSHYIASHGFALNVNPELKYFEWIRPCGLDSRAMTSISKILGYPVGVESILENLLDSFSTTFGLKPVNGLKTYLNNLNIQLDFSPHPN